MTRTCPLGLGQRVTDPSSAFNIDFGCGTGMCQSPTCGVPHTTMWIMVSFRTRTTPWPRYLNTKTLAEAKHNTHAIVLHNFLDMRTLAVHKTSTMRDLVVAWTQAVNPSVRANLNLSNTLVALWTLLSLSSLTPVAIITYPDKGRNKGRGFKHIFISKLHIHKSVNLPYQEARLNWGNSTRRVPAHTHCCQIYYIY